MRVAAHERSATAPAVRRLPAPLPLFAPAAALAAAIITKQNIAPGAVTVFVGLAVTTLAAGLYYANVHPLAAALVLIAPFFLAIGWKSELQRKNAWVPIFVQAAAIALPLLLALAIAYANKPAPYIG